MINSNKYIISRAARAWRFAMAIIYAAAVAGCNDEVFVEHFDPSETEVTVKGNGGRKAVGYSSSKLQTLSLDLFTEQKPYVEYLDREGNRIDPYCNASSLAMIVYESPAGTTKFSIKVTPKTLMIESFENFSLYNHSVTIRLDYGFAVRFIKVIMTGLRNIDLVDMSYEMDKMKVNPEATEVTGKITYSNKDNSAAWELNLKPYLSMPAFIEMEPTESWARSIGRYEYAVPTFSNGEWGMHGTTVEMAFGTKSYYSSTEIDKDTSVLVIVPPYSSLTVSESVYYATMKVPFTAVYRNPVTGNEYATGGTCSVNEPFDYKLSVIEPDENNR